MSTARFDLPATAREVAPARRRVLRQLRAWESALDDVTAADVELVVSELVTNAVLHSGGSRVGVALHVSGKPGHRRLRIDVSDHGDLAHGRRRTPAHAEQESGRGLALVEALAVRSGATCTEDGKDCWAELTIPCRSDPER